MSDLQRLRINPQPTSSPVIGFPRRASASVREPPLVEPQSARQLAVKLVAVDTEPFGHERRQLPDGPPRESRCAEAVLGQRLIDTVFVHSNLRRRFSLSESAPSLGQAYS